jgi:hypothetical protein
MPCAYALGNGMLVRTPPPSKQGSRGLAVVLACVEEDAILVVGVVLGARVSCRVGVATYAHINLMLPTSSRHGRVPNVMRNVLV